jgi:hypothetical protein
MKEHMKAIERIYRWSLVLLGRMETSSAFSILPHSALQTPAFSLHFNTFSQPLCAFQVSPLCLGQGRREDEEVLERLVQGMELALMSWMTHWCMEPGAYGGEDVFELLAQWLRGLNIGRFLVWNLLVSLMVPKDQHQHHSCTSISQEYNLNTFSIPQYYKCCLLTQCHHQYIHGISNFPLDLEVIPRPWVGMKA